MKIFLISNMYPSKIDPDYGIFVHNIEKSLEKNGAVILEKVVIKGRSQSGWSKIKSYIKLYSEIISAYRRNNFDLVYLHFISHSAPGLLLAKTFFGKKKKIVVNVHGSDVLNHHKGILKKCNERLLKSTDLLVVPSDYFLGIVAEKFPDFPKENIYVSPSGGIDPTVFFHQEIPKSDAVLKLGFVSRIEDDKGWRTFIEAIKALNEQEITLKVFIAGKGSKTLVMKELITEYNLDSKIDYLGILPQMELNSLYNQLDLFIFPTNRSSESLGLVGLEAMACGTPVIGSNMAGLKTFIRDGENGFFFTPGNDLELAEKIKKFWELSKDEKEKMQIHALQTAKEYEKERVAQKLYQKFEQLLK